MVAYPVEVRGITGRDQVSQIKELAGLVSTELCIFLGPLPVEAIGSLQVLTWSFFYVFLSLSKLSMLEKY